MEIGKQIVSSTNRTVGQLKFLFRCNFPSREENRNKYRDFHVESSVKFFLLNPIENEISEVSVKNEGEDGRRTEPNGYVPLEQFVGPHLGENLAWRVQEVERKLAMRRGESVRTWLEENYSDNVQSHIVLRGYLFQPLHHFESTSETTIAHDWQFHQNPTKVMYQASGALKTSSNPSIAVDHLRGWWTTAMETDLPAKVRANGRIGIIESRFVILPKLHWLSPVVAVEDNLSGQIYVEGDNRLDTPEVEPLTLDELMTFVQDHFQKVASVAETNKTGGVAMPLLVAEITRCSKTLKPDGTNGHWYELSRGFILDPKCWDPSPLCHEPVRFRRTLRRNVATGNGEREYEARRTDCTDEGFIKPDTDDITAQDEQKRHKFLDPANVSPKDLCHELMSLLGTKTSHFSHAELKRSTKELFEWRRLHGARGVNGAIVSQQDDASAYLRSCVEALILGASTDDESKIARRVGYLLLDVFDNMKRESSLDGRSISSLHECSAWMAIVINAVSEPARWEFLNLVLRGIDIILETDALLQWGESIKKSCQFGFLDKLLAAHSARWNAVVVELIRVFRVGELASGGPTEDAQKLISIFTDFVDQGDWQSAERLVIVVKDHDMTQTLVKHLSLLNMTKALKRLQKVGIGIHNTSTEFASQIQHGAVDGTSHPVIGNPVGHAKNRTLTEIISSEFKWEYVASLEDIDKLVLQLKKHEAIGHDKYASDEQHAALNMLVGIDCEWRPQFLTKDNPGLNSCPDERGQAKSGEEFSNQFDEDQAGLSIYQLAVGDTVFVIDVQVLGAAAAAPLSYIWESTSRLLLIGFCVSSDIQRIKNSFPELGCLFNSRNDDMTQRPLLLELKELALFRQVPTKNWGLSRLYRACLGEQVDKEQQCSDWGSRPLSQIQLEYAAKDAFAVQRLTLHLIADINFTCSRGESGSASDRILDYMKRFDASRSFSYAWTVASAYQPLGRQHVKAALEALGVQTCFVKCTESGKEGILVKSIALLIRKEKDFNAPRRIKHAVAVLPLDRSIDMQALGSLLDADPEDISLADQEVLLLLHLNNFTNLVILIYTFYWYVQTLVRVFGYSRGCLGPIGLREQQAVQIVVDDSVKSENFLLCGAGAADEVYAIAPDVLVQTVNALVAKISSQHR
ncbi:unnamed protein product [Phytophthora fragariaefolia]|uniref:Unnamed protein product n=1 Tax=Phytophthora fragariaefolia TaxID=1490495 RepID=A0A9W6U722_9STRA|nr:unnamed protein product [Phytophthora fragariaefolia]